MYSPRFLLFMVAALCVVDAALLQNFHVGRRGLLDGALNPTGTDDKGTGDTKETPSGGATGSSSPSSPSSPPPTSSSAPPTSSKPPTSSSTTVPTSSSTPPPPTSSSTSSSPPTSQPPSTSNPPPTSSQPPTSQQPTQPPPSSQPTSSTSTFTSVVTSTSTGASTSSTPTSSTPGLNSDKDSAASGMSSKTRNTIIGVVVGVGGAILLGALGMVAYRIWGRKKHSEETDGLMSYDMSTNGYEKHEPSNSVSGSQQTPFQSTLDNYHQPSNVNASSNF